MNDIEKKLLNITHQIEEQIDSKIEQIDNLDKNDLEDIRKQRLNEIKKNELKKSEWLSLGHGQYDELPEEKLFFDIIKKSDKVIVHFYRSSTFRCAILDKHLKILAEKHIETRFVKLNAEKCPFLVDNLKIKTIPSIVIISNSIMIDKVIGFTQLGNCDDFTTGTLEWRLAQNGAIDYDGDLSIPPYLQEKTSKNKPSKKIRDGIYGDDDIDIEECGINKESILLSNKLKQTLELTEEEAKELDIDN